MPRMTQSEYTAYLAKTAPRWVTAGATERESPLHGQILTECAHRGWIALHGSMASPTHRTQGEPDFVILAQERVLFVECKRSGGKCSPAQNAFRAWAAQLGHTVHVVMSIEEFMGLL